MDDADSPRSLEAGEAIRRARKAAGLTLDGLAQRLGCSKGYLSHLETGRRRVTIELARQVEAALEMKAGELVRIARWHSTPPAVRAQVVRSQARNEALTRKLREALANKSAPDLDALRALIDSESGNLEPPRSLDRQIPVINRVAAGYPSEFTDLDYPASIADEYIACPDVYDPSAFAARVVGDSMTPDYTEGEIVVFSPQLPTPAGSDCFVRIGATSETTFKRIYYEEKGGEPEALVRLQPLNPAYSPRVIDREDITGIYAAAYVIRRVSIES